MTRHYEDSYWREASLPNKKSRQQSALRKQRNRAQSLIKVLETFFTVAQPKNRQREVLEIGSSWGETLLAISSYLKSQQIESTLYGIEPNEQAAGASVGNYEKIVLLGRDVSDLEKTTACFDIIIASHVIEHLYEPGRAMKLISTHLSPNGFAYIEVPNYYGHTSYSQYHTCCFTENTLTALAVRNGLKIVRYVYRDGQHSKQPFLGLIAQHTNSPLPPPPPESISDIKRRRASALRVIRQPLYIRIKHAIKKTFRRE